MLFERSLGDRVIQIESKMRTRTLYGLKLINLKDLWRTLRQALDGESIPLIHARSYLEILKLLTTNGTAYNAESDRAHILRSGGLVFLVEYAVCPGEVGILAKTIIINVCQDLQATCLVLKSNIVSVMVEQLQSLIQRQDNARIKQVLAVLLAVAKGCAGVCEDPTTADRPMIEHKRRDLARDISKFYATFSFLEAILKCLYIEDSSIRIQTLRIIQMITRTAGYNMVLETLVYLSGKYLALMIEQFRDPDPKVAFEVLAVFKEFTKRSEGREAMEAVGAVELLVRFCERGVNSDFILGLSVLVMMSQQGLCRGVTKELGSRNDCLDALFDLLRQISLQPDPFPESSALFLHRLGIIPFLVELIVFRVAKFETLSRPHRYIGALISNRLFAHPDVASVAYSSKLVEYLALVVQTYQLEISEGQVRNLTASEKLQFDKATRDACGGLVNLCICFVPDSKRVIDRNRLILDVSPMPGHQGNVLVVDEILRLHALEDIVSLIHKPTHDIEPLELEIDIICTAMHLVANLFPTEQSFNDIRNENCAVAAERLLDEAAPKVLNTIAGGNESRKIIQVACRCLATLGSTNETCGTLISSGAINLVSNLIPFVSNSLTGSSKMEIIIGTASTVEENELSTVPHTVYALLAELARISEGRQIIVRLNLVSRILQRMTISIPRSERHDMMCKTEISTFIARIANTNTPESGNINLLFVDFNIGSSLVQLVERYPKHLKTFSAVIYALDSLSQDVMGTIPSLIEAKAFPILVNLIKQFPDDDQELSINQEQLFVRCLSCFERIAAYPNQEYHNMFEEEGIMQKIARIGSNFQLEIKHKAKQLKFQSAGHYARLISNHFKKPGSAKPKSAPIELPRVKTPKSPLKSRGMAIHFDPKSQEDVFRQIPFVDLAHTRPVGEFPSDQKKKKKHRRKSKRISTAGPVLQGLSRSEPIQFARPRPQTDQPKETGGIDNLMIDPLFGARSKRIQSTNLRETVQGETVIHSINVFGHRVRIETKND